MNGRNGSTCTIGDILKAKGITVELSFAQEPAPIQPFLTQPPPPPQPSESLPTEPSELLPALPVLPRQESADGTPEALPPIVGLIGDRLCLHGDCLELMKRIRSKSIAFIFVGLPYGATDMEWDKPFKQEKYLREWLAKFWAEVERIMMDGGVVCCQAADTLVYQKTRPSSTFASELRNSNKSSYLYSIIWAKQQASDWHAVVKGVQLRPRRKHELVLVFCIGSRKPRVFNQWLAKGTPIDGYDSEGRATNGVMWGKKTKSRHRANPEGTRYLNDIIYMSTDRTTRDEEARLEEGLEPKADTPNPMALPWLFARIYSNPGEWCLDPTMGTGTSVLAFLHAGRKGIGMELEQDTFEATERTVNRAISGNDSEEQAEATRTNNFSQPRAWVECQKELEDYEDESAKRLHTFLTRSAKDHPEGVTAEWLSNESVSDPGKTKGWLRSARKTGLVEGIKQAKHKPLLYRLVTAATVTQPESPVQAAAASAGD